MTETEKLLHQAESTLNCSLKLKNKINHALNLNRKITILSEEKEKMHSSIKNMFNRIEINIKLMENLQNSLLKENVKPSEDFANLIDQISEQLNEISQKLRIQKKSEFSNP